MDKKYHWFDDINQIINQRKNNQTAQKSYTARLFEKGILQIAKKTGEEAVELALAAISENNERFKEEAGDLLFHFMVLLNAKGISLDEVLTLLNKRHERMHS